MAFVKGVSGNSRGRPKVVDAEKPTNKSLRNKAFLALVRKFLPLQTQAIKVAATIMNDEEATEQGRLKSAALIIQTYRELLKDAYDHKYDLDDAEPMQADNKPLFSLTVLDGGKDN